MLFEPLEEAAIQQDVQAIDAYCAERERLAGIRAIDQALGKWGSYSDDTIGGERHSYKAVSVQDLERIRAELQKQSGSGEAE